jgi:hypothetical protein
LSPPADERSVNVAPKVDPAPMSRRTRATSNRAPPLRSRSFIPSHATFHAPSLPVSLAPPIGSAIWRV